MPTTRGGLRDEEDNPANGELYHNQRPDTPDDSVVVDFRKDEETLNWMNYGPEDSRERFSEWSDDKARQKYGEVEKRLRELRSSDGAD